VVERLKKKNELNELILLRETKIITKLINILKKKALITGCKFKIPTILSMAID
jgi:hypothetical protein